LGCVWLLPGFRGKVVGLLSGTLLASSYSLTGSRELAPHQLFAFCSLSSLLLLAKAIHTGRRMYWYGAVIAAAATFCTLEIGLGLLLVLGICGYLERLRLRADLSFWLRSSVLFAATVFLMWPAAILKLSFIKGYLGLAYLALSRTAPWGNAGFLATWRTRLLGSPVEWAMVALTLVLYVRASKVSDRVVYPILMYATLMIGITLRVTTETPRYALAFIPELDLFAGLVLAPYIQRLRRPACLAVLAALIIGAYASAQLQSRTHDTLVNPRSTAVLSFLHRDHLGDKAMVVPENDLPTVHYYFPKANLRSYYAHDPVPADQAGFHADAILYRGYPVRIEAVATR
jgi:hypothetical protein